MNSTISPVEQIYNTVKNYRQRYEGVKVMDEMLNGWASTVYETLRENTALRERITKLEADFKGVYRPKEKTLIPNETLTVRY